VPAWLCRVWTWNGNHEVLPGDEGQHAGRGGQDQLQGLQHEAQVGLDGRSGSHTGRSAGTARGWSSPGR
jgi:hypothetical protein